MVTIDDVVHVEMIKVGYPRCVSKICPASPPSVSKICPAGPPHVYPKFLPTQTLVHPKMCVHNFPSTTELCIQFLWGGTPQSAANIPAKICADIFMTTIAT